MSTGLIILWRLKHIDQIVQDAATFDSVRIRRPPPNSGEFPANFLDTRVLRLQGGTYVLREWLRALQTADHVLENFVHILL